MAAIRLLPFGVVFSAIVAGLLLFVERSQCPLECGMTAVEARSVMGSLPEFQFRGKQVDLVWTDQDGSVIASLDKNRCIVRVEVRKSNWVVRKLKSVFSKRAAPSDDWDERFTSCVPLGMQQLKSEPVKVEDPERYLRSRKR